MEPQPVAAATCPGTSLAKPADVPPHAAGRPTPDAVWRMQRDRFFLHEARSTSRRLQLGGAAASLGTMAILYHAGYPGWRLLAALGLYLAFGVSHRMAISKTVDPTHVSAGFIRMNVSAQLFVVGTAALTGGVHSPFIVGTVLPSIVSLLFFGPQAVSRWIALGNALLVIAMVSLPPELVGPAVGNPHFAIAIVICLLWNIFMLHKLVGKLSVVASKTGESMQCLREERLSDAEAQLRRLQSVGAKVAHELKNPLASIKGLCQLVARTPDSERTQERLAVVASEIARMESILGEYLSFSRPLEDIDPEPIQLQALARDVLDVLDGRAINAGVALSLEGSAPNVHGDPRRLKEALINIVSNAIEATPAGGKVALSIRNGAGTVTLAVKDTGRGIAPENLERLGRSFFTTRAEGTGLGVVLAQGVINQHGGTLAYASQLGKGTTATITLPADKAATPEPSARAAMVEARA
jgi:signal transduction histidine kinase